MNKLIDQIRQDGIKETIKYVTHNGIKYVVDGHHRLIAAKRLGLTSVLHLNARRTSDRRNFNLIKLYIFKCLLSRNDNKNYK